MPRMVALVAEISPMQSAVVKHLASQTGLTILPYTIHRESDSYRTDWFDHGETSKAVVIFLPEEINVDNLAEMIDQIREQEPNTPIALMGFDHTPREMGEHADATWFSVEDAGMDPLYQLARWLSTRP